MALNILFLVTITVAFSGATQSPNILHDCAPGTPDAPPVNLLTVKNITIKGCDKQPCVMYKTDTYECNAVATINFTAKSMTNTVIALTPIGPIQVNKGEMCSVITSGCDNLKAGSDMTVHVKRRINEFIPPYRGNVRFIFKDENDKPLFCTEINVILKEKNLDLGDVIDSLGK